MDLYEEILEIKKRGEDAALVTIIDASGSSPRETGAKMLVRLDGSIAGTIGGGSLELLAIKEALQVIKSGKARRLKYELQPGSESGMICGGNVELFIEPILSNPTLFIFGAGHIGVALSKIARLIGFRVIVIDNRPEYATPERFPDAEQTIVTDYAGAFSQLQVERSSYIVIVTHGHHGDEVVLTGALHTPARYIGMIGSKKKNETVFQHLLDKGFTREQLQRVHAPIGLEINAQTPEEIAVSIMAEIIAVRRNSTAQLKTAKT